MSSVYITPDPPNQARIDSYMAVVADRRSRAHAMYQRGQVVTYIDPYTQAKHRATVVACKPGYDCSCVTLQVEGRQGTVRTAADRVEVRR